MLKYLLSDDAARGASVALVVVTAGLVGQFAAQGMSPTQWLYGLASIAGSIAVAVMVRCWPAEKPAVQVSE